MDLILDVQRLAQWRDAVLNELIVSHIYTKEHDNNPRKAIEDVINWNVEVALDPMVSQGARDLIDQGGKCNPPGESAIEFLARFERHIGGDGCVWFHEIVNFYDETQ